MALTEKQMSQLRSQLKGAQVATPVQQPEQQQAAGGLSPEQLNMLRSQLQKQQEVEARRAPVGQGRGPLQEIKGIGKGIAEDFRRRRAQAQETKEAAREGEQTFAETALQATGQSLGMIGDVVGRTVLGAAEAVTPEFIEKPIARGFQRAVAGVAGTRPVRAAIERFGELQEEQPRLARNLQALGALGEAGIEIGTGGVAGAGVKAAAPTARRAAGAALRGTGRGARGVVTGAGKAAGLAGELAVGTRIKEGTQFAFQNPRLFDEYASGKRTVKDLGLDVSKSTQAIADRSVKDLARVKAGLPKFQLDDQIVRGNIKSIADQSFVDPGAPTKRVDSILKVIEEHDNWTPEGLLDLNTQIRRMNLFSPGSDKFSTSNAVIRDITREIKESATELIEDPRILDELQRSSKTIENLENIGYVFKDKPTARPDQMNKAIDALAKRIDDPNFAQDAKELMDFIKLETGFDIERELLALRAFRNLTQDISQGDVVASIRQTIGRVLGPVASGAGRLRQRVTGATEPQRLVPEVAPRAAEPRDRIPARIRQR